MTAGLWISLYWGSLTAGRFLIGALANHIPPLRLVRFSMLGALAGMALVALNGPRVFGMTGMMLTGFSLASIFPSLIATTPQRLPSAHVPNTVGFQVGSASLGLAVFPGCAGLLARRTGLETIPVFILLAILVMIALHETIRARLRHDPHPLTVPQTETGS